MRYTWTVIALIVLAEFAPAQTALPFPDENFSARASAARPGAVQPASLMNQLPSEQPRRAPLPLPNRPAGNSEASRVADSRSNRSPSSIFGTVLVLAGIVAVLLVGGRWLSKHSGLVPKALPLDAVEHLGRKVLEPRVSVHIVRCGTRLLILGVGPDGVRTLSEITEPVEVDLLAGACRRSDNDTSFLALFQQSTSVAKQVPSESPEPPVTKRPEPAVKRVGGLHA